MYAFSNNLLNNLLDVSVVFKTSEERREAEEERKRIQANIEEHKLLEAKQQAEMKRVRCEVISIIKMMSCV